MTFFENSRPNWYLIRCANYSNEFVFFSIHEQGRSQPLFLFKPKLYSVSHTYQTLPTSNVGTGGLTSFIPGSQQSNLIKTDAQLIPFPCGILLKGKFKINKKCLA